ncbi:hypothetical protein B566_EDAN015769, partial [Ephemera danica]
MKRMENIARVRKDEAKAAEEEKERQRRVLLAEQEARTDLLRGQARQRYDGREEKESTTSTEPSSSRGHVNFFQDLEDGNVPNTGVNVEHEKEAKEEKEKYEKSIGYLTYLGQNTVESTGIKPWWESRPARLETEESESSASKRSKLSDDPLNTIRKYVPSDGISSRKRSSEGKSKSEKKHKHKKKKHKKHSKSRKRRHSTSSSSEEDPPKPSLEQLRAERLRREAAEAAKTKELLAKLRGEPPPEVEKPKNAPSPVKQKYNSQFNPELARQNYDDERS